MRRPAAFRRPAAAAPPSRHGGAAEWETLGSNPVGEEVGLGHLGRVGEAWLKLKGFWKVWNVQIFDMNFHFESAVEGHELWARWAVLKAQNPGCFVFTWGFYDPVV